ncbi:hypothetical protein HK104_008916, partial [Borealophlyctis nickersoniae]
MAGLQITQGLTTTVPVVETGITESVLQRTSDLLLRHTNVTSGVNPTASAPFSRPRLALGMEIYEIAWGGYNLPNVDHYYDAAANPYQNLDGRLLTPYGLCDIENDTDISTLASLDTYCEGAVVQCSATLISNSSAPRAGLAPPDNDLAKYLYLYNATHPAVQNGAQLEMGGTSQGFVVNVSRISSPMDLIALELVRNTSKWNFTVTSIRPLNFGPPPTSNASYIPALLPLQSQPYPLQQPVVPGESDWIYGVNYMNQTFAAWGGDCVISLRYGPAHVVINSNHPVDIVWKEGFQTDFESGNIEVWSWFNPMADQALAVPLLS